MITEESSPQIKEKAEKIVKDMHLSLLRERKYIFLNASGWSMYPSIKDGDAIKVVPVDENDIKIGDIVVVDNEGKGKAWFYVHRVVRIFNEKNKKMYVTKGDVQEGGSGESVGFKRIVGRVAEIERDGLTINLERPVWKYLNPRIGYFSLKHPKKLRKISPYISLAIEWRHFPSKVMRRLSKRETPICNTEELLLICAHQELSKNLINRAKVILKKDIDWDFFMETAMGSGLSYPVYNSLKTIDYPAYIPKHILGKLKIGYLYALSKTIAQYRETMNLLKLFFEKNIPVIPLKGPILSRRIYGDIAARGLSIDIDLLIEEKKKGLARRLLEEKDYIFIPDRVVEEERLWQYMYRKSNSTMIDLHWEINPVVLNRERMKGFWKGTRLREEDDTRFYEFKEEELLLYISVHFVDSAYLTQLRPLSDINVLLTKFRNTLDWASIVEKAKKWRLSNSFYTSLYLSRTFFGSYVPNYVLTTLKPSLIKRIFIKTFANRRVILHKDSIRRRFITGFLKHLLFQLLEAQSLKDYFTIFFPPKEKMGNRTYFQRLVGGVVRFVKALKGVITAR